MPGFLSGILFCKSLAQGVTTANCLSIDPVTKDMLPLSDLMEFLPHNVNGIEGNGIVTYSVSAGY